MRTIHSEVTDDLSSVPSPQDPYFDPELGAWALNRYIHVMAALHDSRLAHLGGDGGGSQPGLRVQTRNSLAPAQLRNWQSGLEALVAQF